MAKWVSEYHYNEVESYKAEIEWRQETEKEKKMKVVYNNFLPFGRFFAINIFGVCFVRKGGKINEQIINHESIHTDQMREMLWIPFYLWYFVEWLVKLFKYGKNAYYNISFEREAYANGNNLSYLNTRKKFSWWKHFFKHINKLN